MNKTIISCFAIVTTGLICCVYLYFSYAIKTNIETSNTNKTETKDRLTVCIETVMAKSIEAKQIIDAKSAKVICK